MFWTLPHHDEVHLWRIDLTRDEPHLLRLISDLERARAARFHQPHHRRRFIVRRAAYRMIMAGYTGEHPAAIEWRANEFGKPSLDVDGLSFNATHSHEIALLAIAGGRCIGVDIEYLREMEPPLNLLADAEQAALNICRKTEQMEAFFRCWTRKEAYLKAQGVGLSQPLDSFAMPVNPSTPLAWSDGSTEWALLRLEIAACYEVAMAVEGRPPRVTLRDWIPE